MTYHTGWWVVPAVVTLLCCVSVIQTFNYGEELRKAGIDKDGTEEFIKVVTALIVIGFVWAVLKI